MLTVDPGKITGWVLSRGADIIGVGEAPHLEFLTFAFDEARAGLDLLVCEAFIIGPETLKKSRGENWSLEQIGALRWMAHAVGAGAQFVLQRPSDAKTTVTDDLLHALDWWHVGSDHARDALRHLALYLMRTDQVFLARAAHALHGGAA